MTETAAQAEHQAQEPNAASQAALAAQPAAWHDAQFRPILVDAHAAKSGKPSLLSHIGMNFSLSPFDSFYPELRLAGYLCEAGFSPLNRTLQKAHWSALKKAAHNQPQTFLERVTRKIYGDVIPGTNAGPSPNQPYSQQQGTKQAKAAWRKDTALSNDISIEQIESKIAQGQYADNYKTRITWAESAMFTALAARSAYHAGEQLLANSKLAVAAELGKDPKDVRFFDLRKSNNPIVCSAMDRFGWQTLTRLAGGGSFAFSLWGGIMANSVVITTERTIFYRPLAYDILSKAINDVQLNSLGKEARNDVVDNMVRVLQAQRFDHRQAMLPREQVEGLRPALEMIADDVIDKRFGITGLMYIMGGGVLIPEDPAQSIANYQHVRDVGVSGVVEEAKKIKALTHAPSTKIWDAQLLHKQHGKEEGNIAESARREELLRERRAILARGPLHSMPGSEIDPTARYGGVQMY